MKTAQEIMTKNVVTIGPHETVAEAIRLMRDHRVGSLLVERVSPSDTWGTITRTDVVHKVIAPGKEPGQVKVSNVMSKPIATVRPDTSLRECARLMAQEDIRRVFVFDGRNIVGILTASDIFRTL
jgi:CBS domain-containing protein